MLRACILLCFGFFSFAVNADNPVPVNIFGSDPANPLKSVPVSTARPVPVSAARPVPVSTARPVPVSTARPVPVSTARPVPVSTARPVPVSTARAVPVSAARSVPVSTARAVPVSTARPIPANVVSSFLANAAKPVTIDAVNSAPPITASSIWLLVDTKAHKIEIKKGEQTIETMQGIAIGRKGAGLKTHRGDDITPYGNYRIGWVGERSNFHKFFGLTYPSVQDAEIALKKGIISERNYNDIVVAHRLNLVPPQDTPLGGKIGIHGLGAGDETVHQIFDWTHGCIALTNSQIDHLSQWLDTGTVVKIR